MAWILRDLGYLGRQAGAEVVVACASWNTSLPVEVQGLDPRLDRSHPYFSLRQIMLKTFICQNSESHRPELTRKEAIKALPSEEAGGPSVLSNIAQHVLCHYPNYALSCHAVSGTEC